ncbi:MAG: hypothetical protein KDI48_19150, partial [Xanthomonadales bacterium]|nr:hypothetical protein [Xanthomonadales bacterium]
MDTGMSTRNAGRTLRRSLVSQLAAAALGFASLSVAATTEIEWLSLSPGADGVAASMAGCSQSIPLAQEAASADAFGNIYLTGCSNYDILTVKYGPDGKALWARRLDLD